MTRGEDQAAASRAKTATAHGRALREKPRTVAPRLAAPRDACNRRRVESPSLEHASPPPVPGGGAREPRHAGAGAHAHAALLGHDVLPLLLPGDLARALRLRGERCLSLRGTAASR